MDIKAFIFDMDGLLFDSERIVQRSWEIAGDELGIPHMEDVIYHTLGMNRAGRNEYFRKYIREDFPFEEFGKLTRDNFWKIVDKEGLPLKKGAKELLAYGKSQGYKMAVATSSLMFSRITAYWYSTTSKSVMSMMSSRCRASVRYTVWGSVVRVMTFMLPESCLRLPF